MSYYRVTLAAKDPRGYPVEKIIQADTYKKTGPMGKGGLEFYTSNRITAEFNDWVAIEEISEQEANDAKSGPSIG